MSHIQRLVQLNFQRLLLTARGLPRLILSTSTSTSALLLTSGFLLPQLPQLHVLLELMLRALVLLELVALLLLAQISLIPHDFLLVLDQ